MQISSMHNMNVLLGALVLLCYHHQAQSTNVPHPQGSLQSGGHRQGPIDKDHRSVNRESDVDDDDDDVALMNYDTDSNYDDTWDRCDDEEYFQNSPMCQSKIYNSNGYPLMSEDNESMRAQDLNQVGLVKRRLRFLKRRLRFLKKRSMSNHFSSTPAHEGREDTYQRVAKAPRLRFAKRDQSEVMGSRGASSQGPGHELSRRRRSASGGEVTALKRIPLSMNQPIRLLASYVQARDQERLYKLRNALLAAGKRSVSDQGPGKDSSRGKRIRFSISQPIWTLADKVQANEQRRLANLRDDLLHAGKRSEPFMTLSSISDKASQDILDEFADA